jgi:hypothetical protein
MADILTSERKKVKKKERKRERERERERRPQPRHHGQHRMVEAGAIQKRLKGRRDRLPEGMFFVK